MNETLTISGTLIYPGEPVRVAGKRGLWRFIRCLNTADVEIVGPYYPNDPSRTRELTRVFQAVDIRRAPKANREDVKMSSSLSVLSKKAKER